MVAKVAGGIIGLGLIGTGSVALAKPELFGINKEISWTPLSSDHDFSSQSSTYTSGKFGSKYKNYLVGVVGNEKDKNLNKRMWEKLLKRWEGSKPDSGKFSGASVKGAYSESTQTENQKALNRVCEDAYKTEITSFGTGNDKFSKDETWKYCSPGTLVTLVNENHGDGTTIGSDSTNKATLVSVESSLNDWFWEIRNKDFWEASGDWSGSNATSDEKKSVFKEAFEKRSETESNTSSRETVKELCGKAYKLKKSEKTTDNADSLKFCKLEADN